MGLILKAVRKLWKVLERPVGSSMEGGVRLEERVQLRNCFEPGGQEWGSRGRGQTCAEWCLVAGLQTEVREGSRGLPGHLLVWGAGRSLLG